MILTFNSITFCKLHGFSEMGEQAVHPHEDMDTGDENQSDENSNDEDFEDMSPDECDAVMNQIDHLNTALDSIEQKMDSIEKNNDNIYSELLKLLKDNQEVRKQLQESSGNNSQESAKN